MDLAVISPVHDLDLSDELSHLYLILSWLCKEDPQYKNHWKTIKNQYKDSYIILDNGANEGKLSEDLDLLKLALDINVDEIVLPDEYLNTKQTINKTKSFLSNYYSKHISGMFNTMAVLQGEEIHDFLSCYKTFLTDSRINILGVGYRNLVEPFKNDIHNIGDNEWRLLGVDNIEYLSEMVSEETFYYTLSRVYFLRRIINFDDLKKYKKKIHLLGIWNPIELSLYNKMFTEEELSFIRGCDSAAPCQAAQAGVEFNPKYGVKDKPKAYLDFEKQMTPEKKQLAKKNIDVIREWVK